jgi:hypothetical protein
MGDEASGARRGSSERTNVLEVLVWTIPRVPCSSSLPSLTI